MIAFALGGVVTLLAVALVEIAWHVGRMPVASTASRSLPLTSFDPAAAATVRSGQPNFRALTFATSPDNKTTSGVWSAEGPSSFEWSYGSDEAVYIHEGLVHVDYQGKQFSLGPGETAFFHAGTRATWTVPQHVRKSWSIHETSRLTRWYRQLTGSHGPR
ncbi:MAG: cupin domain-containing protein [Pseudomonadota bacterium]